MSYIFSKLKEQATSKLETLAKNIKENQQNAQLMLGGQKPTSPENHHLESDSADSTHETNSPNHKKRVIQDENFEKMLKEKEAVIDRFRERVMQLEIQLEQMSNNESSMAQSDHSTI